MRRSSQSDATFAEVEFVRHASFKRARFEGAADFSASGFEGLTAFSGTRFDGPARFGDTRFEEPAYFENTRFASGAGFRDAEFAVEAFFKQASWSGPAAFHGTRFNGETRFQFARFDSEAAFYGARFRRLVSFAKAEFRGPASFGGVNFARDALFSEALFPADARFDDAAFRGAAGFEGAVFKAPVRLNAAFSADLVLRGAAAPLVDLRGGASLADSARVYLQHSAIDRLTADWPQLSGRLAADGDADFAELRPVYASLRRDLRARGRGREAREAWVEWMDRLRSSSSWTDPGRIPLELFSLASRYGTDLPRLGGDRRIPDSAVRRGCTGFCRRPPGRGPAKPGDWATASCSAPRRSPAATFGMSRRPAPPAPSPRSRPSSAGSGGRRSWRCRFTCCFPDMPLTFPASRRRWLLAALAAACGEAPLEELSPVEFSDVARESGLRFDHFNGFSGEFFFVETAGPGGAFIDADGDGWVDVYLVNGARLVGSRSGPPPLNGMFRNRAGAFTDVTDSSGAGDPGYGMGCAAGDFDNDGDPDLLRHQLRGQPAAAKRPGPLLRHHRGRRGRGRALGARAPASSTTTATATST